MRYPRGEGTGVALPERGIPLEIGKGRIVREGTKIALLSLGTRLQECLKAAEQLAAHGLSTTVADARFAKPLDTDLIRRLAREHEVLITIEEGAVGGFGSMVLQDFADRRPARSRPEDPAAWSCPTCFLDHDAPVKQYDAGRPQRRADRRHRAGRVGDRAPGHRRAEQLIGTTGSTMTLREPTVTPIADRESAADPDHGRLPRSRREAASLARTLGLTRAPPISAAT